MLSCYYYKDVLLFLVTQMHLNDSDFYFIFTDVTELFSVYFGLILFFSIQVTIWFLFYHIFSFFCPALYLHEFKFIDFIFYSVTSFWCFSGLLASYILIPFGWDFFLSFQTQQGFYFEARIGDYFKFYTNVYFLCLVYCQLFTVLFFFLTDIQKSYTYLKKYRKLYYYLFLLFSTLMTPPDLFSQILTSSFMILTYELVIFFSMLNFFIK